MKLTAKTPKGQLKQFIKFFSAIPSKKWCTGVYENSYGQKCALGHLGVDGENECRAAGAGEVLCRLLDAPSEINDGDCITLLCVGYDMVKLKTPKDRILAALRQKLKELG